MSHEPQASGFRLKVDFAQASDPGRDPNKQVNEDSCGYAETRFGHLAVLCDGMGGHYGGREASRCAITTIFEVFEQMPASMLPAHALKAAIEEAGRRVYLLGGPPENRARPGSTVVAMLLHDRGLDCAHVGDSRAYIIRSNQIYPLTRDHSMVQGMIDAGMLTEESAMGHPDSNKITRALGMKPDVDVELRPEVMELYAGDILLQSSDGLTDLALGRDILGATRQALASGGVEHACTMLVKMANDRGGHDNITVQMVRVTDVASKTAATIPDRAQAGERPRAHSDGVAAHAGGARGLYEGAGASAPGHDAGARPQAPGPTQVTSPDGTPANFAYGAAPPAAAVSTAAAMAWAATPLAQEQTLYAAPVTAAGPVAAPAAPPPTLNETPAWTPASAVGAYAPPSAAHAPPAQAPARPPTPPPALAAYRLDAGPAALPLPPQSMRGYGAAAPAQPAPYGTPAPGPTAGGGGFTPEPGGFAPPAPLGAPRMMMPPPSASRGGVFFVIIGLSAVIAILILVVLVLALR